LVLGSASNSRRWSVSLPTLTNVKQELLLHPHARNETANIAITAPKEAVRRTRLKKLSALQNEANRSSQVTLWRRIIDQHSLVTTFLEPLFLIFLSLPERTQAP
jgi:hypothetical protein